MLVGGKFSCLRNSSGDGIPGVGVAPGFFGLFSSASLGIPGIGVAPRGSAVTVGGIPAAEFVVIGTGLPDSPGGIFAGSIFTAVLTTTLLAFALFALFTEVELEQAKTRPPEDRIQRFGKVPSFTLPTSGISNRRFGNPAGSREASHARDRQPMPRRFRRGCAGCESCECWRRHRCDQP